MFLFKNSLVQYVSGFLTPLYGCHASKINGKTNCLLAESCGSYLIKSNVQEVGVGGVERIKIKRGGKKGLLILSASHRGVPCSIPGESMCDLRWRKWRWDRFFIPSQHHYTNAPYSFIHSCISDTIILAIESAFEPHASPHSCCCLRKTW
jgi:hypothetical protein